MSRIVAPYTRTDDATAPNDVCFKTSIAPIRYKKKQLVGVYRMRLENSVESWTDQEARRLKEERMGKVQEQSPIVASPPDLFRSHRGYRYRYGTIRCETWQSKMANSHPASKSESVSIYSFSTAHDLFPFKQAPSHQPTIRSKSADQRLSGERALQCHPAESFEQSRLRPWLLRLTIADAIG